MSIFNIFNNLDESSKTDKPNKSKRNKKNTDNATAYRHHTYTPTPALNQGQNFKNYQNKITQRTSKNARFVSREGFQSSGFSSSSSTSTSSTDSSNNLSQQAQQVLSQTQISSQDQSTLQNLKQQYASTLVKYQILKKAMSKVVTNYFDRVEPDTNPYLNQNVKFSTGQIAYVTNRGILKIYMNQTVFQNTSGKNGCPTGTVNIDIPWSDRYIIPGTVIPTRPTLITGTPMQPGQSCGYEGENVFVNSLMTQDPSSSYMNCYADNSSSPAMTFIGGSPSSDSSGNYSYQMCQQAAVNNGSAFFALQDVDLNSGLGYCAISDSSANASQYGLSYIPTNQTLLWQSNTDGSGNTATITDTGSLCVLDASGSTIYSTPYNSSAPTSYLGCYKDNSKRAMSKSVKSGATNYNYESCMQQATNGGYTYFGLQWAQPNKEAQCFLSSNFSQSSEYGRAHNCTDVSGTPYGGGWSNAVYNASSGSGNYYLKINDNGKLSVHRGTGPTDNQDEIWNSGTKGQSQNANSAYAAVNGVFGTNYMTNGQILQPGQFLGSADGKTVLIMQTDGNLCLYTFTMSINCQQMSNGYMGGGVGANAVYQMFPNSIPSNFGQVSYVGPDSALYSYPSSSIQYGNTYTSVSGMTNPNNNISNAAYNNYTLQQCQNTCNSNSSCAGFVYSNTTNTCYPKTSGFYPSSSVVLSNDDDIYVRNVTLNNLPMGIPNTINNVDTVTYQNYLNTGTQVNSNMSGLSSATSVQKQQLQQLQDQLNMLSQQISNYSNQFSSDGELVQNQITTDVSGSSGYENELNMLNAQISSSTSGLNNILNDSNIVVLQESYNYMFWSTLAVGALLISINMKNN